MITISFIAQLMVTKLNKKQNKFAKELFTKKYKSQKVKPKKGKGSFKRKK
jgi:stalled ribosome alternative rescue factor ArfA